MPGYIIASQNSTLRSSGLCQATSSRGTAAFSATPAYAKLHHREAQHHSQQNRPMPSYIIASFSATPAYARLHHREAQQHPAAPRGRGEQRLPPSLGPVVLPGVPLLVGVDQGEELTHCLLGRLPTTHLLQTLRNPWQPRSAMYLRAGLAQGQSTGLLPRAQAAFWCGKPCLAESHVGI